MSRTVRPQDQIRFRLLVATVFLLVPFGLIRAVWADELPALPPIADSRNDMTWISDEPTIVDGDFVMPAGGAAPIHLSSAEPKLVDPVELAPEPQDEFLNEGDQYIAFPEEEAPLGWKLIEAIPTILTKPNKPLGHFFEHWLHTEHDLVETDLEEEAIGLQPIPSRPQLILELNEKFLGPGYLNQGIEIPTGAVWRPSLWIFGEFRSGINYFDDHRVTPRFKDPIAEWANRLDLFAQLNLSGTERVLLGLRPLDEEEISYRDFTSYEFIPGQWIDGWNPDFQTAFFEGDFGEIFPWLDPYDSRALDYGFSVGRMPLLTAQSGLLINEDLIDAVTVTRNTLSGLGNLNLRISGAYAWSRINRNSPIGLPNTLDPNSRMFALLTESDYRHNTIDLDVAYVTSDSQFGDLLAFGASAIRRINGYKNTYNVSLEVLASFPTNGTTPFAQQGELLFGQFSWTPHHREDLIYLNSFLAIDQFTSPARGPLMGGPLGQVGLLFAAPGLGLAGAAIPVLTNHTVGASLGYQLFFDHTRRQVIVEVGGQKEYNGPRGAVGTMLRYQQAMGQHTVFILDAFVAKRDSADVSQGVRTELLVKF